MNITIDKDKLEALILESVDDTLGGYWESESFVIGHLNGLQVRVEVTKDVDDFSDMPLKHQCITFGGVTESTPLIGVGSWLKNKETGEVVKVTSVGFVIEYTNAEVDGSVRADRVLTDFDVTDNAGEKE